MANLIQVLSKIELFSGDKMRKTAFVSGYRPLFDFLGANIKISGSIDLINGDEFKPGNKDIVRLTYLRGIINDTYINVGSVFTFSERANAFCNGEIIEILYGN